ncbi:hypothetical protein L249_8459 [Ophiocordyceps polyrhachis-furcata BCC 54312]|uniref:Uncharacterized protein n=1 Tax=Ophiocordyceps polyrhachis-furcata BCC 54312 TaxID=1330021 RepID=A0A367L6Q9_9HYPO|nr:hypothetical protein L249_8459 [Ophiocordyceps polyrhachis-furcata BCC 54312]
MLCRTAHARADTPQGDLVLAAKQAEQQRQRTGSGGDDALEDEGPLEVAGRCGIRALGEGAADEDEDGAEELAGGPGNGRRNLGAQGVTDFCEELEGNGEGGEASGTEDGEDDVRTDEAARLRHPDEDEVAEGDERQQNLEGSDEGLGAVYEGRGDGGDDEADEDEDGAADASIPYGTMIWFRREEKELKKPTLTAKGMKTIQSSGE